MTTFTDFLKAGFWDPSDYADKEYVEPRPSPWEVARIEKLLGYKLPAAYIELAGVQNGGMPVKTCHRSPCRTSWAEDHVAITGIAAIGDRKTYSLGGSLGSAFMMEEWGYPPIGVYFGDCPSAGHDMIALDYRLCGPHGEPRVVHVDQEFDYAITLLAPDFERFIRGLEDEEAYPIDIAGAP